MNVELLRQSFELVIDRQPDLTVRFYDILFARYPEAQRLFKHARETQEKMLAQALLAVVENLDHPEWLGNTLGALGARHIGYGVTDEMYGWVGESLLATLREAAGEHWTAEIAHAWTEAYAAITEAMLAGARRALTEAA